MLESQCDMIGDLRGLYGDIDAMAALTWGHSNAVGHHHKSPAQKQTSRESCSACTFQLCLPADPPRICNLNVQKQSITPVKYFSQGSSLVLCRTASGLKSDFLYMNTHSSDIYRIIHLLPTGLCFALLCAWLILIGMMLGTVYGK